MLIFIRLNQRTCNASKHIKLIQLMNIISNLIFHCNNCDANTACVIIRESTAAAPSSSLLRLMQNLRLRDVPHQSFSHG